MPKIIMELNPQKPLESFTVLAWTIKEVASTFVPHFTYQLNNCVKNKGFPKQLTLANVTPFFTKEDFFNARNSQPNFVTNAF